MNFGKIPEDPKIPRNVSAKQKKLTSESVKNSQIQQKQSSSLDNFFKLPPKQIVEQINKLLKSDQAEAQKLLEFAKININNKQQITLAAFSCLVNFCKINLTKEEEKEIFKAIEEEQEENQEENENPEKKKKRQIRRKASLKKRISDPQKYKTNLLLGLLNKAVEILEKKVKFDFKA